MYVQLIAQSLQLRSPQVNATLSLLESGATVPFISRYRKEATGNLDEVQIAAIKKELEQLTAVSKRKETIRKAIEEQGKLTPELDAKLNETWQLNQLEDLYLPYKSKRKTRAEAAREKGLEGLAGFLMKQSDQPVEATARRFVKGDVKDTDEALQGARDIMAEWMNERAFARNSLRGLFRRSAVITAKVVKGKTEEAQKYRDYFAYDAPLRKTPGHRLLAMLRGEAESVLKVSIAPPKAEALQKLESIFIKHPSPAREQLKLAVADAWKRLLKPSLETEFRNLHKEKADAEAIAVFAENLRQLLLAAPLGSKTILAIDPGFRTGCKVVCLDQQGSLQHNETIYPHPPQRESDKAASKIATLVNAYKIQAIAVGNGTAGRETEEWLKRKVRLPHEIEVFMVNEAGASVYSASKRAREEFPDYDVTVRGAVSIGRRLMDPLAELVKIDPKSIGVGQYQHDVDQNALKAALDDVVESCVNKVGVQLNVASKHLLAYVSGLGPALAEKIVTYRVENGAFTNREQLKNVPGLGPKAYEQCAGFLRIHNGNQPLDNSAVHPESYAIVKRMAKDLNMQLDDLIGNTEAADRITPADYVSDKVGLPTLNDILNELKKPGRDPRGKAKAFKFDDHVRSIEDLRPGMLLPGIVTNITRFGAFVDVGAKQDGLVHISELADEFVSDPAQVVRLGQVVQIKVLETDLERKRIAFTMKGLNH